MTTGQIQKGNIKDSPIVSVCQCTVIKGGAKKRRER